MIPHAVARDLPAGWGWRPRRQKPAPKPRRRIEVPDNLAFVSVRVLVGDLQTMLGVSRTQAYRLAARIRGVR
jgi:hypothetical protein